MNAFNGWRYQVAGWRWPRGVAVHTREGWVAAADQAVQEFSARWSSPAFEALADRPISPSTPLGAEDLRTLAAAWRQYADVAWAVVVPPVARSTQSPPWWRRWLPGAGASTPAALPDLLQDAEPGNVPQQARVAATVARLLTRAAIAPEAPRTGAPTEAPQPKLIPADGTNPFLNDLVRPNFVMDPLTIYYTSAVGTPVAEMVAKAPSDYTGRLVPVPPDLGVLKAYSVLVTKPGEYTGGVKAVLRQRSIAVIEWYDGTTIEQFVETVLSNWEKNQPMGRQLVIDIKDGRLGVYL